MASPIIKSSKEIILLLLYAKGKTNKYYEPIVGKTRLMKMIFLFKEELKKAFNKGFILDSSSLPDFTAYDFGPFSYEVYSDLEFLKINEFIMVHELKEQLIPEEIFEYKYWNNEMSLKQEDDNQEGESYILEEYTISELGKEFTEERLLRFLTNEQKTILDEFKKKCTEISLRTLLRYVYKNYPKMITHSKIREDILKEFY